MKKPSPDRLIWFCARQRRTGLRQLRLAGRCRRQQGRAVAGRFATAIIPVPQHLLAELTSHRAALLITMNSIDKALRVPRARVLLDFTRVKKLYPGGTLVLLAHLERLLQSFPGRIKARCMPGSLAAQLLGHFGIAAALKVSHAASVPKHESVLNWQYLTGTQADGAKISSLLQTYRELTEQEPPQGLYDVLTEALTNVRHHAYPGAVIALEPMRRWWLFSRYDAPKNKLPGSLYIAVYDLGIGIQNSFRGKLQRGEMLVGAADELASWMGLDLAIQERVLLKHAVEGNRTSTGLAHRGKGLPEMRDFVKNTRSGRLYIISGRAQYACVAADDMSSCISCHDSFPGTLILWSIPLEVDEEL